MTQSDLKGVLPERRDIYAGGSWLAPISGDYVDTLNPGTGEVLASVAQAGAQDADVVVALARKGFCNGATSSHLNGRGSSRKSLHCFVGMATSWH